MAIVGVALNLSNRVNTLAALAHASIESYDTVRQLPDARRDDFLNCCDTALAQRLRAIPTICASFLDRIDLFCPEFFSVSRKEGGRGGREVCGEVLIPNRYRQVKLA